MNEPYEEILGALGIALDKLATKIPAPQKVPFAKSFVFRYVEHTAQQAIVQKLVRFITGLRAELLLLRHGLLQEHVIERVLDELREDITFLAYCIFNSDLESLWHKLFLDSFYEKSLTTLKAPLTRLRSDQWCRAKKFVLISLISREKWVILAITGKYSGP